VALASLLPDGAFRAQNVREFTATGDLPLAPVKELCTALPDP